MPNNPNDPTVAQVAASCRGYLNDIDGITWTDAHLLPLIQEAHKELQAELSLNDIAVVRTQITNAPSSVGLHLPAYQISLSLAGLMPSDLLEPIEINERDWGDTTPEDYLNMIRMSFLPNYTQNNFLFYWTWMGEDIVFLGATTDRDLQIRYRSSITTPRNMNSTMGFLRAELYVGPRAASLACGTTGDIKKGNWLQAQADRNLDVVIRSNVKNDQGTAVRRIPYRRMGRVRVY
jgi:hypothetical protein